MYCDPRINELQALAREERITLPYPAHYIAWLKDRGRVVDLISGEVYNAIVATPTVHARAVCHLLAEVEGEYPL